jgi:hypothetical protein
MFQRPRVRQSAISLSLFVTDKKPKVGRRYDRLYASLGAKSLVIQSRCIRIAQRLVQVGVVLAVNVATKAPDFQYGCSWLHFGVGLTTHCDGATQTKVSNYRRNQESQRDPTGYIH